MGGSKSTQFVVLHACGGFIWIFLAANALKISEIDKHVQCLESN